MSRKPSRGPFFPKNPQKYMGNVLDQKGDPAIIFRSSWELTMMNYLDAHPCVLGWMSEGFPTNHAHRVKGNGYGISYLNPFTRRWTFYKPDFFVIYIDPKTNKKHQEVIEIKPFDEVPPALTGFRGKVNKLKEAKQILNAAKYEAAIKFCAERGWFFRIMTEKELFAWEKPR